MRRLPVLLMILAVPARAQVYGAPQRAHPPRPAPVGSAPYPDPGRGGDPSGGYQPAYGGGGCSNCGSFAGNYYGSNLAARPPAPPLRLQGQWRNGQWYY